MTTATDAKPATLSFKEVLRFDTASFSCGDYGDRLRRAAAWLLHSEPGSLEEAEWTESVEFWATRVQGRYPVKD